MENFFINIKTFSTILHVIAAVVGMGAALMSDLLFNFYAKDKVLNNTEIKTLDILSKVVWWGLSFLVLSGFMLFFSDPNKYIVSTKFIAKMSILFVLVVNGFYLSKRVWPHLRHNKFLITKKESGVRKLAFVGGTISVVSWFAVLVLGIIKSTSLPYLQVIAIYILILVVSIPVALLIEKKNFE